MKPFYDCADISEEVLHRYEGKVYRLCCALLREPAQAQDAAQESLLRIWKAMAGYDGRASLSTWIYAITRNRCLTALERRRAMDSLSDSAVQAEVETIAGANENESAERSERLRELVDLLPERPRQILVLYYFEECSISEVRMPKNADLQVEADDGSVEVSSINGNVSIRTADSSIKASKLSGMNDLHTGDGSIRVAALAGETKLHTSDGTIDAASIDGKCDVSSSDGSIHLAGRFDSLDVKAGDGSVTARVAAGSRISSAWSIRTADGSVDVAIPTDFKSDLDLSTSDGHVTLGLPVTVQGDITRSQIRGTMNGGGPTLTIHSDDGSIRLSGI